MQIVTNFRDEKALVPENTDILFIDYSISSTFESCEEKCRLAYCIHKQSRQQALPLAFGSAMHKAIEVYHNNIGLGTKAAMKLGLEAMTKDLETTPQMPRFIRNSDDEKRSVERCRMLFAAYVNRWSAEMFTTKHVEVGFAIDLGISHNGKPIIYVGKIDRIVEKFTRSLHNVETKTTAVGLNYFMEQKKPNHQVTGYHVADQELLGIAPDSTIWDAIFISTRKEDMKKGGWFEYGIDIDHDFDRQETHRSDTDIKEWYYDIRRTALQFFQYKDSGAIRWRRNDKMCHQYGGCSFRRVCEANLNQALLENEYVTKEWEPWRGIIEKQLEPKI